MRLTPAFPNTLGIESCLESSLWVWHCSLQATWVCLVFLVGQFREFVSTFGIRPRTLDLASWQREGGCQIRSGCERSRGSHVGRDSWASVSRQWGKQERRKDKQQFMRKQNAMAPSTDAPLLARAASAGLGKSLHTGCRSRHCLFVLERISVLDGRMN